MSIEVYTKSGYNDRPWNPSQFRREVGTFMCGQQKGSSINGLSFSMWVVLALEGMRWIDRNHVGF